MIPNTRLFDHYGIDTTKNLNIQNNCPRPFDTILIDKNGSCFACECTSWLPQSIGNLQIHSLEEIVDSKMHKHLQSSMTDNTYRFCNEHQANQEVRRTHPMAWPTGLYFTTQHLAKWIEEHDKSETI